MTHETETTRGTRTRAAAGFWTSLMVLAVVLTACAPATSTSVAVDRRLPADVTDYRGSVERTGQLPGPGPERRPVQLWRHTTTVGQAFPPVISAGLVLVPDGTGLTALDLRTGEAVWEADLGALATGPLTVADRTVYGATADGVLHAVDLTTQQERWTSPGAAPTTQVSVVDGTAYFGSSSQELAAVDAASGTRRWSVALGHSTGKHAIADDVAYLAGDGGSGLTAVDLRRRTVLWTVDTGADRVITPAVDDGTLFVTAAPAGGTIGPTNGLTARDPATGRVRWRFSAPKGEPMAAFAVDGTTVYTGVDLLPGRLFAVHRTTGEVRWERPLDGPVDRPQLVAGVLYVATGPGGLLAFDSATGEPLWDAPVDGFAEGVSLTGGVAVVAARSAADAPGSITAFGESAP